MVAITLLDVEAGLLGEMDALGQPLHQPGDADLVDHLGELAGARGARAACRRARRRRSPARRRANGAASPPHITVSAPFSRAGLAARDRRIDEVEAALLAPRRRARARPRPRRWCGRRTPRPCPCRRRRRLSPSVTSRRSLSLPTQHKTKSWPAAASFGVCGALAAELADPLLGLGGGAVVDGDVVAALVLEMPGHRVAHDAEAEKRHFRHRLLLAVATRCYAAVIAMAEPAGRSACVNGAALTAPCDPPVCWRPRPAQGDAMASPRNKCSPPRQVPTPGRHAADRRPARCPTSWSPTARCSSPSRRCRRGAAPGSRCARRAEEAVRACRACSPSWSR